MIAMILLLVVQLALLVYYGSQKSGFHEDELYTYYSTNKTAGLFVEDRQWMEREQLFREFTVLEGEGFRYSVVKMMQSWDVHPPLYYYIIHTVSSLTPGMFSKWQGIGVNLLAYVLSFWLLAKVMFTVVTTAGDESKSEEVHIKARWITFLVCFFWGFSSAVISGVMFIRMYQWLTMFVLLCLWLHVRALKEQKFGLRFLLPLSLTVFLGFLTQYYYIIWHIFLGAGFCFLMLKSRKIKEMFTYAGACAVGLGAALLYYPSALSHIFRGYRGTEAVSEFMNTANTWDRLQFFVGLFDDYVMDDTLSVWLLVVCLLAITAGYLKKKNRIKGPFFKESVGLMIFAAVGYFFTISQTALLLGETSNRYELPVYGVIGGLLIYGVWSLTERCAQGMGTWEKRTRIMAGVLLGVLLVMNITSMLRGKVFFLYEGEREVTEFVRENRDIPVVVSYNEGGKDHVWWLSDKLMESERFYLVSQQNPDFITDERVTQSDSLLVYVSECEEELSFLESLIQSNPNLSSYRVIAKKEVWTLYEVS